MTPTTTRRPSPKVALPKERAPLSRAAQTFASRGRAKRLLTEGYRFTMPDTARPELWDCVKPGGETTYHVDLERCTCTCLAYEATATCSHLLCAMSLSESLWSPRWGMPGVCECGAPQIDRSLYVGGRGYVAFRECWGECGAPAKEVAS